MKVEIVQVSRRPQWPFWAVLLIMIWLALGSTAVWLGTHLGLPLRLCLFKRLTGVACPTCGFSRSALSLLHGQLTQAWLYNPLLCSVIALYFTATAVRLLIGRSLRLHLTRLERALCWIIAVVLVSANWAYVVFYVR